MLTTLAEKVHPDNAAIMIIDVTNDFCHSDSPRNQVRENVPAVQESVVRLESLVAEGRRAGVPIIFVHGGNRPDLLTEVQLEGRARISQRYGDAKEQPLRTEEEKAWGNDFYGVIPNETDLIFEKHRYSAFPHTNLKEVLEERGVKSLIVTGVATNVCVESTARDAYMLDFYVVMVDDCCGGYTPILNEATYRNISDCFGVVVTSDDVKSAWASVAAAATS